MSDWDPFDWAIFLLVTAMGAWLLFLFVFFLVYA